MCHDDCGCPAVPIMSAETSEPDRAVLDRLRSGARQWLKQLRIPLRSRQFVKALASADHFGDVSHHAAWLEHHSNVALKLLDAIPEASRDVARQVAWHAFRGGVEHARIDVALTDGSERMSEADRTLLVKTYEEREKRMDNLKTANADRMKTIDAQKYDKLLAAGHKQYVIAAQLCVTGPTLRSWRKKNGR